MDLVGSIWVWLDRLPVLLKLCLKSCLSFWSTCLELPICARSCALWIWLDQSNLLEVVQICACSWACLFPSCVSLPAVLVVFGVELVGPSTAMTMLEAPKSTPELSLSTDSRFDPDPPRSNSLAAPKRPFTQIVTQTNTFLKMDIPIKSPTFKDAGEPAVFFS